MAHIFFCAIRRKDFKDFFAWNPYFCYSVCFALCSPTTICIIINICFNVILEASKKDIRLMSSLEELASYLSKWLRKRTKSQKAEDTPKLLEVIAGNTALKFYLLSIFTFKSVLFVCHLVCNN